MNVIVGICVRNRILVGIYDRKSRDTLSRSPCDARILPLMLFDMTVGEGEVATVVVKGGRDVAKSARSGQIPRSWNITDIIVPIVDAVGVFFEEHEKR